MNYLQKTQQKEQPAGDSMPGSSDFEPSDIPGFLHPRGNKAIYVLEADPSQQMTRDHALAMFKSQGGGKPQPGNDQRGRVLYPPTN